MSNLPLSPIDLRSLGLHALKKNWCWFLALGVLLVVCGLVAIGSSVAATLFSMILLGSLLLVSGAGEVVVALTARSWGGFFVNLLIGVLYLVTGMLVVTSPVAAAEALTLLFALSLLFSGVLRIVLAISSRFHHWVWMLLNGVISVALGMMIWSRWPLSGLWVIGLYVGIELLFNGWSLVMLGLAAKNLPVDETPAK
ncbi:HdeD family acid-resistance protein [Lignipirellula cremea]|uniref:Acid-resistance membrane protein n=1 Tax=Lignipirellula cremea TaxID=2528010 RepID=A0A518DTF9_9BACT|nr:DUF308 domain-containing protein [Lignipirellula cremea]QDU95120.1 acid-resistance membrane protein [Lignipirellula cremea]